MDKLKLLQKELVLVAILLLLELVLVGTFKLLVNQSASEATSIETSESIMSLTGQIQRNLWDQTMSCAFYTMTRNDKYMLRLKALDLEMISQMSIVQRLAAEFPEDRAITQHLVQSLSSAGQWEPQFERLERQVKLESEGRASGTTAQARQFIMQTWRPWISKLIVELTDLSEYHGKLSALQKIQVRQSKSLLGIFLVLSAVMQVVLAVVLVVSFNKSITSRLKILQDNSRRLTQGQLLHPRMTGEDEIAELDSVFHKMALTLTESAIKQHAMVDGMPVGFISMSADGRIESVNPRTQQMLKTTATDLIGKPLSSVVVAPDDGTITFECIKTSALDHVVEMEIRRTDGTIFPAELSISAVRIANQEQLMCNLLDVTERHDVERMRREFVAMVSHDLKSPLTSIDLFLYLLDGGRLGTLDQRGKKVVDSSRQETARLIRLVTNLLDIARMESGRIDLVKSQVDLDSIIERSQDAVIGVADEKKIKIAGTHSELQIVADADRLVQVVVNFLGNAIKFSPAHSTVKISCRQLEDEIEISVSDEGPGIAEAAQKRIFERFEQVLASDRKEKGGTGLGLAICKLIVEAHGGTIGVESQVEKGSTFWLRIPLVCTYEKTQDKDATAIEH